MKWTDEEIDLLKENYMKYNDKELSKIVFKGKRSEKSIEKKRLTLSLKKSDKREIWSEEEKDRLKELFPHYTNRELSEQFFTDRTMRSIGEMGRFLKLIKTKEAIQRVNEYRSVVSKKTFLGVPKTEEQKLKQSERMKKLYSEGGLISAWKGRIVSEEEREKMRQRAKGRWSGENNPRHKNPLRGKENGRWQGGITPVSQFLRENIVLWKDESMKYCDYKCVFTGLNFNEIHHINPFNKIIKETLKELNVDDVTSLDLSNENIRDSIINNIQLKHTYIGLCVTDEIHKRFHDIYTYNEFNIENLIEFTKDYFDGKHDEYLSDSNKSINSKSNYTYAINKIANSKFNIYEL